MVVCDVQMLWRSEALSQVWGNLCGYIDEVRDCTPAIDGDTYLIYDNACHLHKYSTNEKRVSMGQAAKDLAQWKMMLDRMHVKNHVDECQQLYGIPPDCADLKGVDSMACEQYYKWLSSYRWVTCNMSAATYELTMLFIINMRNEEYLRMLQNDDKLISENCSTTNS